MPHHDEEDDDDQPTRHRQWCKRLSDNDPARECREVAFLDNSLVRPPYFMYVGDRSYLTSNDLHLLQDAVQQTTSLVNLRMDLSEKLSSGVWYEQDTIASGKSEEDLIELYSQAPYQQRLDFARTVFQTHRSLKKLYVSFRDLANCDEIAELLCANQNLVDLTWDGFGLVVDITRDDSHDMFPTSMRNLSAFFGASHTNTTLRVLCLYDCLYIGLGWKELLRQVLHPDSLLEKVDLRENGFKDERIASIFYAARDMKGLRELYVPESEETASPFTMQVLFETVAYHNFHLHEIGVDCFLPPGDRPREHLRRPDDVYGNVSYGSRRLTIGQCPSRIQRIIKQNSSFFDANKNHSHKKKMSHFVLSALPSEPTRLHKYLLANVGDLFQEKDNESPWPRCCGLSPRARRRRLLNFKRGCLQASLCLQGRPKGKPDYPLRKRRRRK